MQPAHDIEELRLSIISHLPVRSRWLVRKTPVRWDFSRAAQPLHPLAEDDAAGWKDLLPSDWRQILIFGEEDVADGGGASPILGIHQKTREVLGIDVEREPSAVFLLNSSVPAFVATFLLLEKVLGCGGELPRDLRDRVRNLDPGVFERSEWREWVAYLDEPTDGGAYMPLQLSIPPQGHRCRIGRSTRRRACR